ncbi:MAG: DUF4810 domain-containing protein [Bacteroidales bacterium]|jgi:hypothetical protein|nr:DUF4810 domain-containing protein [Bacteroidales bacterium]
MKKYYILAIALLFVSCSSSWTNYKAAMTGYYIKGNEKSLKYLLKMHEKLVKDATSYEELPPPGICADYGYLLIQKGEVEKGKELMIKETIFYPQSKKFIDERLKSLEK